MSTNECREFLRKVKNADQDIRSMAISDLLSHLNTLTATLPKDDGEQYTNALIELLLDAQSYVQNLATECLGQIFKLIDKNTTLATVTNICTRVAQRSSTDGASALSVALRVMVSRVAESTEDKSFVTKLARPIVSALSKSKELPADVNIDMFAALSEVVESAGSLLAISGGPADAIQALLLDYSTHRNPNLVRRAFAVLGKFVVHVTGERSENALNTIFQRYQDSTKESDTAVLLGVLVAIARQRPACIRPVVPSIIDSELKTVNECDTDLRVASLLAFETIVRHCPELARERSSEIYAAAIKAAKYDPSYNYEDGDDDLSTGDDGDDLEEEFGDEFDEDIYDDHDDTAWNIRTGGVRLLGTLAKSDLLSPTDAVEKIGSALIGGFKERVDVVRVEVLTTYAALLDTVKAQLSPESEATPTMEVDNAAADAVVQQAPQVVSALISSVKQYPKSTETKQLAFAVLSRIVSIRSSALDSLLAGIQPVVSSALVANDSAGALQMAATSIVRTNLKLDVLEFLRTFVARSSLSDAADELLFVIKDGIKSNVSSKTAQVPATAFSVAGDILTLLRLAADTNARDVSRYIAWVQGMATLAISMANTNDSQLRVSVYNFIGTAICQFGDIVGAAVVDQALSILTTWKNGTANVLALINALAIALSLSTHLPRERIVAAVPLILEQIDPVLRQNEVKVYLSALGIVQSLSGYGDRTTPEANERIMLGVIGIIEKSPTSPPVVALQALASVCVQVSEESIKKSSSKLVPLLSVVSVHDKHGAGALEHVYEAIGKNFPSITGQWKSEILGSWKLSYDSFDKQRSAKNNDAILAQFPTSALANAARSLLALFIGYYKAVGQAWTVDFLSDLWPTTPKSKSEAAFTCLALRVLGYAAASGLLAQEPAIEAELYAYAESSNDDVRNEAAFALGSYVGNYADLLSTLFDNATASTGIGATSKLLAVKAALDLAITTKRNIAAAEAMWAQISAYVQASENPVSDVIAQILAIFVAAFPEVYIPQLASCIANSSSTPAKVLFITAFRTVLADKHLSSQCDAQIKLVLPTVLASISDADINVRRLTLLALYTLIQTKLELVEDIITSIQPALFQQTVIDESVVREISMGPFKRKIDDGLEMRKVAYMCVHLLVRHMLSVVDGAALVDCVVRGLPDDPEVRVNVQHIVMETVSTFPSDYAARLEDIGKSIKEVREFKVHKSAVKQEVDKKEDAVKVAVSIAAKLQSIATPEQLKSGMFATMIADMNNPSNESLYQHYKICTESPSAAK
ncbi:Cullin-associated NEDD8-dissociated protein 1 [Coemansia sp. S610]|nr:Cullin-associated NEDD8-dissociated protein 1 [Coemansia sp. S610]